MKRKLEHVHFIFSIYSLIFRLSDFSFGIHGFGLAVVISVWGFMISISAFMISISAIMNSVSEVRISVSAFMISVSGTRISVSIFRFRNSSFQFRKFRSQFRHHSRCTNTCKVALLGCIQGCHTSINGTKYYSNCMDNNMKETKPQQLVLEDIKVERANGLDSIHMAFCTPSHLSGMMSRPHDCRQLDRPQ